MATQKQIEANRINAKKSTGPKTAEGKAVAKLNRLTHGLRAEQHVLPNEDPAEFQAFVDTWVDDWKPATMARLELVEEAAVAAWRRKRCRRVETERIARRMRGALNRRDREEKADNDAAIARLLWDPKAALEVLMRSRAGVDRQVAVWEDIERASRSIDTWDDHMVHHGALIALQGHLPDDPPMVALRDASWALYLRNVPEDREEGDEPIDDAEAARAADWIHGIAVKYLAWLAKVRPGLPDPMREAELKAFAPQPEDAALLRYEAHLSREFHRSLGNLVKLTKTGDDLVEAEEHAPNEANSSADAKPEERAPNEPNSAAGEGPEATAPNEPDSSTESDAEEGVATDPESAKSPNGGRRADAVGVAGVEPASVDDAPARERRRPGAAPPRGCTGFAPHPAAKAASR